MKRAALSDLMAWKTLRQRALLLFAWLLIVMTYFTPRYQILLRQMGRRKGGEAWPERWRSSCMRMCWFEENELLQREASIEERLLLLLLRPSFRLFFSYLYAIFCHFIFGYWPFTDISVFHSFSDSLTGPLNPNFNENAPAPDIRCYKAENLKRKRLLVFSSCSQGNL